MCRGRDTSMIRDILDALHSIIGVMEPLIDMLASAIAVSVALLAGLPAARRATAVQPMVAIRSE